MSWKECPDEGALVLIIEMSQKECPDSVLPGKSVLIKAIPGKNIPVLITRCHVLIKKRSVLERVFSLDLGLGGCEVDTLTAAVSFIWDCKSLVELQTLVQIPVGPVLMGRKRDLQMAQRADSANVLSHQGTV